MRRTSVLAVALLAIGCSSHSGAVPDRGRISPQILQQQPLNRGWAFTYLKPVNGRPVYATGLASDPNHKVWVVAETKNGLAGSLTKIAMDQHLTVYSLAITPSTIALGSDNNLWISSNSKSGILARVTLTGAETDFTIASGMNIGRIISGPDGALWFTECGGSRSTGGIGRMTTDGSYTFYSSDCQGAITNGPDGNVWFSDGPKVYEMSTQGVLLGAFPIPFNVIFDMTTGSDGALYLTGNNQNVGSQLIRVTTTGSVSPIAKDRFDDQPITLTSGPDGNLWITTDPPALALFNPVTQTYLNRRIKGHNCGQMLFGADGNLWEPACGWIVASRVDTYIVHVMKLSALTFNITVGQNAILSVSESKYSGQWTALAAKPAIASITPNSQNGTFVITGQSPGTTTVAVYDSMYNSIEANVTVTQP